MKLEIPFPISRKIEEVYHFPADYIFLAHITLKALFKGKGVEYVDSMWEMVKNRDDREGEEALRERVKTGVFLLHTESFAGVADGSIVAGPEI